VGRDHGGFRLFRQARQALGSLGARGAGVTPVVKSTDRGHQCSNMHSEAPHDANEKRANQIVLSKGIPACQIKSPPLIAKNANSILSRSTIAAGCLEAARLATFGGRSKAE